MPFHGYQVTTVGMTISNQTTLEIGVSILEFGEVVAEHVSGDLSQGHIRKRRSWEIQPTHQQSPHKVQPSRGHLAELQQCFGIQRTATERSQTRSHWAGKANHSLTDTGQSQSPSILNRQHLEI